MESSENKRRVLRTWLLELLYGVLGVVGSLVASLIASASFDGVRKNVQAGIWIPVALSAAVALLLVAFTYVLRREPSKVLNLRQKLVSTYVDKLAESMRGSGVAGKA